MLQRIHKVPQGARNRIEKPCTGQHTQRCMSISSFQLKEDLREQTQFEPNLCCTLGVGDVECIDHTLQYRARIPKGRASWIIDKIEVLGHCSFQSRSAILRQAEKDASAQASIKFANVGGRVRLTSK